MSAAVIRESYPPCRSLLSLMPPQAGAAAALPAQLKPWLVAANAWVGGCAVQRGAAGGTAGLLRQASCWERSRRLTWSMLLARCWQQLGRQGRPASSGSSRGGRAQQQRDRVACCLQRIVMSPTVMFRFDCYNKESSVHEPRPACWRVAPRARTCARRRRW